MILNKLWYYPYMGLIGNWERFELHQQSQKRYLGTLKIWDEINEFTRITGITYQNRNNKVSTIDGIRNDRSKPSQISGKMLLRSYIAEIMRHHVNSLEIKAVTHPRLVHLVSSIFLPEKITYLHNDNAVLDYNSALFCADIKNNQPGLEIILDLTDLQTSNYEKARILSYL
jgi:hypothetical protein